MFRHLADSVDVPVVAHLDHGHSLDECRAAIDAGFTSLMFDGSRLPLSANIAATAAVADLAHAAGLFCEGEIGFVGYARGEVSAGTDPADAALFARDTRVDAIAVSVRNLHLQQMPGPGHDLARIRATKAVTSVPLVIHGGSGMDPQERATLCATTRICKVNIGTELRQAFGATLRAAVLRDPNRFDRIAILAETEGPVMAAARLAICSLGANGRG